MAHLKFLKKGEKHDKEEQASIIHKLQDNIKNLKQDMEEYGRMIKKHKKLKRYLIISGVLNVLFLLTSIIIHLNMPK